MIVVIVRKFVKAILAAIRKNPLTETLRMHSPATFVTRVAEKEYKVPGYDTVLEKGTTVLIPIDGIHYNSDWYEDPEEFRPERFSEENKAKRPACTHIPFGEGPRICIGENICN